MDTKTKELFIIHTKISEYKRKVAETKNELKKLFSFYHKPSISVSGGKDSLVLLHLSKKSFLVYLCGIGIMGFIYLDL